MPHAATQDITHAISLWLKTGRSLSDDVRRYADTVLGDHDEATLRDALSPDHPDFETFAEFLLFPDEPLLRALDAILHPHEHAGTKESSPGEDSSPFSNTDMLQLTDHLEGAALPCLLHLAHGRSIEFVPPPHVWRDTVRRLHLDCSIPAPIRHRIARLQPQPLATFTRCRLKASRLRLEGPIEALTARFLDQYPCGDPAYPEALVFWLHFLSSLPADTQFPVADETNQADYVLREQNPWHHLHKRHQRLKKALRQSQEFTERMQRYSMDLIMMQGAQAPFIHEDAARKEIQIMERISLAVFGKAAGFGDDMRETDYGTVDPADMTDVMRTLSLLDK
ncbi:hypothetical protein N1030_02695 [Desulfovibrio mangrovi]|uniref:hypothetical protein n=1 Tax=Desulfovibrio mangrovi TaxID=2976983 RepID=UPI002246F8CD|nr:hypothetical protein [Desulfovibrio mangrovi]UZP67903.1 hypothetical protein N1030_02695 [Desulfovibrio mangrovi]